MNSRSSAHIFSSIRIRGWWAPCVEVSAVLHSGMVSSMRRTTSTFMIFPSSPFNHFLRYLRPTHRTEKKTNETNKSESPQISTELIKDIPTLISKVTEQYFRSNDALQLHEPVVFGKNGIGSFRNSHKSGIKSVCGGGWQSVLWGSPVLSAI